MVNEINQKPSATSLSFLLIFGLLSLALVLYLLLFSLDVTFFLPILGILGILEIIIFITSITIVYFDCKNLKNLGFWKEGPGDWALLVTLLWVLFLPWYLYKRSQITMSLPTINVVSPHSSTNKAPNWIIILLIIFISGCLISTGLLFGALTEEPKTVTLTQTTSITQPILTQNITITQTITNTLTQTQTVTNTLTQTQTQTVTTTPKPPSGEWIEVIKFQGTTDRITESFSINGEHFRLKWSFKTLDPSEVPPIYTLYALVIGVEKLEDGTRIEHLFLEDKNCQDICSDTTYIYNTNGKFYLVVIDNNIDFWEIIIEEFYE